ncbi:protein kinase PINOID 2-like [Hibiscus syriacus]|uniref:Protein kinase PINOID 2-like n=1 Tax=Hibiscus syriacus TaxID=106335 RepID=A0A6A3A2E8_HIBSY|nr:protein kinase PINOID 2-like [Hibiscus syriacus]KAE8698371.1 protein kinase PINOID 2-like [Hibiscus syriacus]
MPKERRDRSVSFDGYQRWPLPCSSSCSHQSAKLSSETEEILKEWEEARCPVCMEHPHNAILLICSSHEKGCRPFMCDTSYRHSYCFDQFRKSFVHASTPQNPQQDGVQLVMTNLSPAATSESTVTDLPEERTEQGPSAPSISQLSKLVCPLCCAEIKDWIVVERARRIMNAKPRSCASDTCNFSGAYKDLRKHARLEHPTVRPSEADPERQQNWRRLERQRDLGDLVGSLQSSFAEEGTDDNSILPIDDGSWLTVFFLVLVFRPGSSWSGTSGMRTQSSIRRSTRQLGRKL